MRKPSNLDLINSFRNPRAADPFLDELISLVPMLKNRALALMQSHAAADDLVQDTVEHAIASRRQFNHGTSLRAWMGSILRHLFIDGWRHTALHFSVGVEDLANRSDEGEAPRIGPADLLCIGDVHAALTSLSPRHREVFALAHVEQESYCQIASRLGISVNTVGTRLHRARTQLRAALARTFATRLAAHGLAPEDA